MSRERALLAWSSGKDSAFGLHLLRQQGDVEVKGEFHTFAWDGPMFTHPIRVRTGEVGRRDGFMFADLLAAESVTA